jgi:hypothetical protein
MGISNAKLLLARLHGIKSTLERTPPAQKAEKASLDLVQNFNSILTAISEAYPELSESLPKTLSTVGPFSQIGKAPLSFIDLEAFCEQTLNLLRLIDQG